MSLEKLSVDKRQGLNLTSFSILHQLIGVCLICAMLWGIIVATITA